jgi:hypothetical protein
VLEYFISQRVNLNVVFLICIMNLLTQRTFTALQTVAPKCLLAKLPTYPLFQKQHELLAQLEQQRNEEVQLTKELQRVTFKCSKELQGLQEQGTRLSADVTAAAEAAVVSGGELSLCSTPSSSAVGAKFLFNPTITAHGETTVEEASENVGRSIDPSACCSAAPVPFHSISFHSDQSIADAR